MRSIFILILMVGFSYAQKKLIDYGFEDWTGNANTTPGYIFTSSDPAYWNDHIQSTEVVSSCNGLSAHTGTYYMHQNFYTGAVDPCLGNAPSSVNDHGNVGGNFQYPNQGYGDNTDFTTDINTDTLVVRFWFRTQGNWNAVNPGNKCKFTRTYGGSGSGYLITHYDVDDNRLQIYNPADQSYGTGVTIANFEDGNWHAFSLMIVINNHNNSTGNITAWVWFDDYDMEGNYILTRTVTCAGFNGNFRNFDFWQNWSASYPSGSMGIDLDDIQVWDGIPHTNSDPPPSQVRGIQVTAQ